MCTAITLKGQNGDIVHARTQEFGFVYNNGITFIPRNTTIKKGLIKGMVEEGQHVSKYAILGETAGRVLGDVFEHPELLIDGLNEKGLSASMLYYNHYAKYKEVEKVGDNEIELTSALPAALQLCADVHEVEELVEKINARDGFVGIKGITPPSHLTFVDRDGNNIVLEPDVPGKLIVKKGNGMLTNSPNYEFHLTNLSLYANLINSDSRNTPVFTDIDGNPVVSPGNSGAFGLPGDVSPASRFLRANYYVNTYTKEMLRTPDEMIIAAQRILNNFDLTPGISLVNGKVENPSIEVIKTNEDATITAHTDHTVYKDLTNLRFYYKDFKNQSIRFVDMNDYDFDGTEIKKLPMMAEDGVPTATKVTLS